MANEHEYVKVNDVFGARKSLQVIRDRARATRRLSPWAVLGACIAYVLAATPPELTTPAPPGAPSARGGSLNMYIALVGRSGAGKGEAVKAAIDALRITDSEGHPVCIQDHYPQGVQLEQVQHIANIHPGTGEGLISVFLPPEDPAQPRVSRGILMVDEITELIGQTNRRGSVTVPKLLSLWSGAATGNTNASADTSRSLAAGSYRLTCIANVQPSNSYGLLQHDGSGLPQRFAWFDCEDPETPEVKPVAPPPLDVKVPDRNDQARAVTVPPAYWNEDDTERYNKARGAHSHEWDSHRLFACLKLAVALSLIDGRTGDVNEQDWHLAKKIWQHSSYVRYKSWEAAQRRKHEKAMSDEKEKDAVLHDEYKARVLDILKHYPANCRKSAGEYMSTFDIKRGLTTKQRQYGAQDLVAELAAEGKVLETTECRTDRHGRQFPVTVYLHPDYAQ
ncbi:hypothetical protein F7230_06900 [Corynebacterium sp. 320]|uniref:hypothetical protein n=1 Tax=Corynebacterium TaxID=1716 RepID=UPI00125CC799|nr:MULTISPECIES: hypothetical protein [Corynebacterium]KAB1502738.1 hypothetical protein F7230_06900 [Corynebacterium sp. 320]KAB1550524.1 hypothetical protein F7232_09610 [Corynebacterium sp. 319]KAB1554748.1 hypothetical protein F7233_00215 [Corynebacterium sp. 321]KAB3526401.1 hypothetical protein F8354_06900 [Corynebacterium sp. 250]KAB3537744.1 hypothetical protein F8390_09805 [Corynebacterium sp. 366]